MSTLEGSCLCGAVRYRVEGEVTRFYHCHCSRCRKATGTGHASNVMVKLGDVSWLQGESLLNSFKVPEAERFMTTFCTRCGSPLPRVVPKLGVAVIPAGSLDTVPEQKPQARIFWDSRVEWTCDAGDLPVFGEYPPGIG